MNRRGRSGTRVELGRLVRPPCDDLLRGRDRDCGSAARVLRPVLLHALDGQRTPPAVPSSAKRSPPRRASALTVTAGAIGTSSSSVGASASKCRSSRYCTADRWCRTGDRRCSLQQLDCCGARARPSGAASHVIAKSLSRGVFPASPERSERTDFSGAQCTRMRRRWRCREGDRLRSRGRCGWRRANASRGRRVGRRARVSARRVSLAVTAAAPVDGDVGARCHRRLGRRGRGRGSRGRPLRGSTRSAPPARWLALRSRRRLLELVMED